MRIANNLSAITAFNSLNATNRSLNKTIQALSTGLRINSASDDAAGFAVSEKMRSQISGLDTAIRNAQDGISLLQTAEGALGQANSMLQRMRELTVQASNDTLTSQDRGYIQLEIDELKKQIDNIANNTQFNEKRILDGSSGALWASSDFNVKAKINGGLTYIDQFGQKVSSEGNYRIEIKADPGQAQVRKTNIMYPINKIEEPTTVRTRKTAKVVFCIDVSGSMGRELQKVKDNIAAFKTKIESSGVDDVEIGICTYGTGNVDDPNFVAYRFPPGTSPYSDEGSLWSSDINEITELLAPITAPYSIDTYNYYAVQKAAETYKDSYGANSYMVLVTDVDHTTYGGAISPTDARITYTEDTVRSALFGDDSTDTDDINLTVIGPKANDESSEFYSLCNETGGKMFLSGTAWGEELVNDLGKSISEEVVEEVVEGEEVELFPADSSHKLSEIKNFISPEGTFILSTPKQITLHQGGKSATVTLDASDTLGSMAEKLNNAIAKGLGQERYTSNHTHFATYVSKEETADATSQGAPGTIVLRSVIPGKDGEITLSGDDDLLNVLGLNTIQESSETRFTASIYDAHTGKPKATGIHLTGNVISGVIPNVDIEFDPLAGISSTWDENSKRYFTKSSGTYSALLHLKDNSITFQTGSNKGEDFTLQLGDISCSSLGISNVNAVSRETASRSIGVIDRAINKISSQRAKIGAFINGLEHTMENLTTTNLNLTSAESRIRDADMAQTMMEFVKLQVLNQSGTSMLAQANQLPQSVLSLLGG